MVHLNWVFSYNTVQIHFWTPDLCVVICECPYECEHLCNVSEAGLICLTVNGSLNTSMPMDVTLFKRMQMRMRQVVIPLGIQWCLSAECKCMFNISSAVLCNHPGQCMRQRGDTGEVVFFHNLSFWSLTSWW